MSNVPQLGWMLTFMGKDISIGVSSQLGQRQPRFKIDSYRPFSSVNNDTIGCFNLVDTKLTPKVPTYEP
ncbi:hypothetical protein OUZ56_006253 [Daphnia magna]|uniref:Uncharacterized protein n=1 Tax=Daphnia magna TaxID=35525 RepID=A0ABQ9YV40_9CRUS|nr:hypothetical protein OUZ56_006253 [Daphnia magna]